MIPIGLYRRQMVDYSQFKKEEEDRRNIGQSSNRGGQSYSEQLKEIKYVITNPQKSIKLRADDLVFVLAQSDPCSPETWDDYNYFNNKQMPGGENNTDSGDKAEATTGQKRGNPPQEQTTAADAND